MKLIKIDRKDIFNVTDDFYFKQMLFFLILYTLKYPQKY